jgi:hypothetical protein
MAGPIEGHGPLQAKKRRRENLGFCLAPMEPRKIGRIPAEIAAAKTKAGGMS